MSPLGAIAQLGERLICIQEVVGSIPSGSTICFADGVETGDRPSGVFVHPDDSFADVGVYSVCVLFDIVKSGCVLKGL